MDYFAKAPIPREQMVLFVTTLDERIPEDHPVRLFLELLSERDFSDWEAAYCQRRGQPPIPPRVVASALLYGMSLGIRSSRRLEYACSNHIDFLWLVEGRHIDHSTFCKFRTRFTNELKGLFREIGRTAMSMGAMRLNEVGLDGTRVRANSSRFTTATAKTLEERLSVLDEQVAEMFDAAEAADRRDGVLFDESDSPSSLPRELATAQQRRDALQKALEAALEADAKRRKRRKAEGETSGGGSSEEPPRVEQEASGSKRPAKVPVADPESTILPNKEGGYAPNYNPVATADGHLGMIADCDVLSGSSEADAVVPTVERITERFGQKPDRVLADGAFATGHNLSCLGEGQIEAFMPVSSPGKAADNPAVRADPRQPVDASLWDNLPRRAQSKTLDRSAFVYDEAEDCYFCPLGRKLTFVGTKAKGRKTSSDSIYRRYRCETCEGCPLAEACLSGRQRRRTVSHDQHEAYRQAAAKRLATEEGRRVYARRAWLAETPNAVLKTCMGVRQFLLRGLEKVRAEWLWACTAFNLAKLVRYLAGLRARLAPGLG